MVLDLPLVLLAGGKSSRMGEDKSLLPFKGYPTLAEYQYKRLNPYFKKTYLSAKSRSKFNFTTNVIEDDKNYKESAPFIALISSFEELDSEFVAFLSVDVPFFTEVEFRSLAQNLSKDGAVAVSSRGVEPLCAIYSKAILPNLKKLVEMKKYRFADLFERIEVTKVEFGDNGLFANLNTKEEYEKWSNI